MADMPHKKPRNKKLWLCVIFSALIVGGLALATLGSIPPSDFPANSIVTIRKDSGMTQTADALAAGHVIASPFMYKAFVVLLGGLHKIKAGDYVFDQPESALKVAYRTINGIQGLTKIKVTIPEGLNTSEMAQILVKKIPDFNAPLFVALSKPHEGYLFPDTYFFYENTGAQQVIDAMMQNFNAHVQPVALDIKSFGKPETDVISMASIVEKEATSTADRRIVAGVLWKRLKAGMPLQVDPVFYYLLGKSSSQLTMKDLATTSPYNLYTHAGLPPTPIDSPGLDAITDTINPTDTKFWFYLSGDNGIMHYAATLDQQNANKAKYIK